ncbi:MAG: acetyl-CoA carboxylase biotin carboxyl carrier protein [Bryobacterales bacterium]|nr:acetyl-CoA carboxylase biotin carboxyl carrier protein [Bryobacterales bacterium]
MTIDEIKEILQVLMDSGVSEIEVQRGDNRVWIKRSTGTADAPATVAAPVQYHAPAAAPAPAAATPAPPAAKPEAENLPAVKAPIVGTFYESPSPGAAAFVKVGDTVQAGQVLCIIESMKLMNEIEAEAAGVIVSKLVPNGKPVEYGEALFLYRPL